MMHVVACKDLPAAQRQANSFRELAQHQVFPREAYEANFESDCLSIKTAVTIIRKVEEISPYYGWAPTLDEKGAIIDHIKIEGKNFEIRVSYQRQVNTIYYCPFLGTDHVTHVGFVEIAENPYVLAFLAARRR